MRVLVVNCGSSSIKAAVVVATTGERIVQGSVERLIAGEPATLRIGQDAGEERTFSSRKEALQTLLVSVRERLGTSGSIEGVGHRVVHGGASFSAPVRIDEEVMTCS